MEGIPNTPHDAPGGAAESTVSCPACGAAVPARARFCGACGAAMPAQAAPRDGPAQAAPPAQDSSAPAKPAAPPEGARLCNWCRNYSPAEARVCESCGAVFPTPEADAALDRAARERIDDMQADIARTKAATWWPFRGK